MNHVIRNILLHQLEMNPTAPLPVRPWWFTGLTQNRDIPRILPNHRHIR